MSIIGGVYALDQTTLNIMSTHRHEHICDPRLSTDIIFFYNSLTFFFKPIAADERFAPIAAFERS
jgi:hypothetical protein